MAGWLASTSATAAAIAIGRDAGIARRALLGVSPAIRNPENRCFAAN
jgi:hypothetical protein